MTMANNPFKTDVDFDSAGTGGGAKYKFMRVKDRLIVRILPPFRSTTGSPFAQWWTHWGLIGANGKQSPVVCPGKASGCPICVQVGDWYDEQKRLDANGVKAGDPRYDAVAKNISDYRVRQNYLYNAVTYDGELIVLDIPKTPHEDLWKIAREQARKPMGSFNAFALEGGAWFLITRTGTGFKTEYKVDFHRIQVQDASGDFLEKIDRSPIKSEVLSLVKPQLESQGTEGPLCDINDWYERKTAAEIGQLFRGQFAQAPAAASQVVAKPLPTERPAVTQAPAPTVAAAPTVTATATASPTAQSELAAEIARLRAMAAGDRAL